MSLQLYRNEAARQRLAAEASTLRNVRERCERAAQAWDALAGRSERADATRTKAAADKLLGDPSENPDRGLAALVRRDT
ncbi:hypothetical protein [Sphingomonas sp. TZW2008]|uniref:hypothetical protein n=1 Tax=Sphingomonas sp. TZW2008 TaxID=1917973 RepID=UPI001181BC73|nr:hypothetical protein [Sphingomonas sp. TZW2008]